MRSAFWLTCAAVALLLSACGSASTNAPGTAIQVTEVWTRTTAAGATAPMAMSDTQPTSTGGMMQAGTNTMPTAKDSPNGAAYMTIRNSGSTADRLIKAQSDIAGSVELHTVEKDGDVMKMRPVEGIDLPSGGAVVLKPGGFHVMLIGLNREIKAGDTIKLTLQFEQAGLITVEAEARAP